MEESQIPTRASDREKSPQHVIQGMVVSLGVHLAIATAVIIGTITGSEAIEKHTEEQLAPFTPVELVRLGEEKPDSQLPRLANPPPKEVKEDVVDPTPRPPKDSDPKEKPPKDAVKVPKPKEQKVNNLLNEFEHDPTRPVNNDVPSGHRDGVPQGTLSDAALQNLMRTFQARVQQAVLSQWRVPSSITREKATELAGKTRVVIRVSAEGYIVSYTMSKRSGDAQFDASVERAVKAFMPAFGGRKLPMPDDAALRQAVVQKGISLSYWKAVF